MSQVRMLIARLPYIAGVVDADRFAKRNLMLFDYEVNTPNSVFKFRESDKDNDRLAASAIPREYITHKEEYGFGMDRLTIAMLACDKAHDRLTPEKKYLLEKLIASAENTTPTAGMEEINNILPVDDAQTMDVWF